jgi:hypothetical protein
MPIHDWTRVEPGIFHDFHHAWIEELKRALNRGILPPGYYALAEQHAAGFGPDVLTLQGTPNDRSEEEGAPPTSDGSGVALAGPRLQPTAETDLAFYRRKQSTVAVRHVSGDRIVAMIEVVSPGNKASRNPIQAFVQKVAELLTNGVHLLILDLLPPGPRDPDGIHGEIWEEIAAQPYNAPKDKPLTLVAYECDLIIRSYVVPVALGDVLPDMPLFLEPQKVVEVPLEASYTAAFAEVPRRWRRVLEAPGSPAIDP